MQALNEHIAKDGFRLRGTAMSRIDGFSDVVFGFALTLLVVSLEVPRTYDEFHTAIVGFLPFAVCFFFLILIWRAHFKFFRRYGLHDLGTIWINCALLFAVLFYVYPLKFLFSVATGSHIASGVFTNPYQPREMMIVYGLGFAAIYLCLSALYFNAFRLRQSLELNRLEVALTLSGATDMLGIGCIGVLCAIIARILPPQYAGDAGWFFFLVAAWSTLHGFIARRFVRRARSETEGLGAATS
jgi:uncharacterized membrane protein